MEDRHLTLELLRAIHRDERSPGDLVPVAMAHLFELCPHCRKVFEAWRRELGEGVADASLSQYDPAFERLQVEVKAGAPEVADVAREPMEDSVEVEEAVARNRFTELLALSPRERVERLQREPDRYAGPVLAELLLEEARSCLPRRPRDSYSVAGLARAVLQHGAPLPYSAELYSRALAYQANALRVQGELRRAGELFELARFLLKSQGGGDRLTRAELDSLEGSLRRAQRRFGEARALFSRAVMAYALEGNHSQAAGVLVSLGIVYREMGEFERAIETTLQACETFEREEPSVLQLFARHNVVNMLVEAGRPTEARVLLEESTPLYERFADRPIQLRRLWVEGHLAMAEEDLETAASLYASVRDSLLEDGMAYDAALASLDLALVYAKQGRTAELKRVAEEIVPVFESQDVHREAATALMLFRDAVRTEQITLRYLVDLSRYLKRARHDPSLAFHTPT